MLRSKPFRTALAILLVSASLLASAHDNNPATDSLQEFLLASSALDFSTHEQTRPAKVKNVYLRYRENDNSERIYMLCGKYQPIGQAVKPQWVDFATIKTEGYEQWLGAQAKTLCKNTRAIRGAPDLSVALQSRLAAE